MLNEVILEKYKIQPVGDDMIDLICPPENVQDFIDYCDDMIGVSKDTRTSPQVVKLWVSPTSWPYIKTKPLHGTQKKLSVDKIGAIITIKVYLNYELEQLILSHGENMRVIEPPELKERMQKRLAEAIDNYSK